MMRKIFFSVIVMSLLFACMATSGEKIPFSTLGKGYYAYGIEEEFEAVIYDDKSFSTLWNEVASGIIPPPPIPEVDFENEMVIAVSPGPLPTGGYDVEIVEIFDLGDKLEVIVVFEEPNPDDFVTEAITQPHHIVSTEMRDVPVEFVWK